MIGREPVKDCSSRSHITINDPAAVRRWTRHFGVTEDELRSAIAKVGNSVAAVRKQMRIADPR